MLDRRSSEISRLPSLKRVTASLPLLPVSWHRRRELLTVLVVVGVCCVFALWVTLLNGSSLRNNLLTTYAIGLSQLSLATLVRVFYQGRLPAFGIIIAIPAGYFMGSKIGSLVTGSPNAAGLMLSDPGSMQRTILSNVLIGVVITAFFLYFSHSRGVREALERERRRAAEAMQAETAAQLALLQAQIEPHFLFNTLATIQTLIKEDPDTACTILEKLDTCLRTSLRRSRQTTATLDEEIDIVEALFAIASARLGSRLEYVVSVPTELRSALLPPLLLQPLVENAIRHGIEPAIDGGEIRVEVRRNGTALELTVADTGVGLSTGAPEGVGLANVRARLASLYGDHGKLLFYANAPRGVVATLSIPFPAA